MKLLDKLDLNYGLMDIPLFTIAGTPITLATLVIVGIIFVLTWFVSFLIRKALRKARSELNEEIWWALKEAGITIAFPQVDVHLDRPVVESLARICPGAA